MALGCYPCMQFYLEQVDEVGLTDDEINAIEGIVMAVAAGKVKQPYVIIVGYVLLHTKDQILYLKGSCVGIAPGALHGLPTPGFMDLKILIDSFNFNWANCFLLMK